MVRELLEAGGDTQMRTEYGDTALSEARSNGHAEVVALLEAAGATAKSAATIKRNIKKHFKKLGRPCWRPKLRKKLSKRHALSAGRFGGYPPLLEGEPWPTCPSCGVQLSFAVQLDLAALPDAHPLAGCDGIVQVFFCPDCPGEALARRLPADAALVHGVALHDGAEVFPTRQFTRWYKKKTDYPYREPGDADFDAALAKLDVDEENSLFLFNLQGDKLGGWPNWVQDNAWPEASNGARMELLLQIDSYDALAHMFGDNGVAFVFASPGCEELSFFWQSA